MKEELLTMLNNHLINPFSLHNMDNMQQMLIEEREEGFMTQQEIREELAVIAKRSATSYDYPDRFYELQSMLEGVPTDV
jgi:hypothetical protein